MSTIEQRLEDVREQTTKFSAILERALDKPRLDIATMREQILSNTHALIIMNHAQANAQGTILGLEPPPMIITTREGDQVRAEVVNIVMENYTRRFHMRTEIRGSPAALDAEALLSLYEESKRIITNAKRFMEGQGLFQVI
ncbi:hypothetical protein MBLNU13_g10953t1 [Cladosporium sp. NU13]